mmetsp:Transcript_31015/g.90128  ORF Transcript_31015/g.90128 Transcript_31015/m.90128 type:complete len:208 (-) Transcript_31015:327-950(-)
MLERVTCKAGLDGHQSWKLRNGHLAAVWQLKVESIIRVPAVHHHTPDHVVKLLHAVGVEANGLARAVPPHHHVDVVVVEWHRVASPSCRHRVPVLRQLGRDESQNGEVRLALFRVIGKVELVQLLRTGEEDAELDHVAHAATAMLGLALALVEHGEDTGPQGSKQGCIAADTPREQSRNVSVLHGGDGAGRRGGSSGRRRLRPRRIP